ncbi:hypothetical protein BpHYR1_014176 [Brachionus plicatilis]|uniref:Uncharacterized protein n=1 Tax=Brachionus plicatilis TaxID=10195 RepID=A0A3M7SFN2_BRAPC|nr:hypothetical protein BpHYR1_014176 [Brachionus plicatilis]
MQNFGLKSLKEYLLQLLGGFTQNLKENRKLVSNWIPSQMSMFNLGIDFSGVAGLFFVKRVVNFSADISLNKNL